MACVAISVISIMAKYGFNTPRPNSAQIIMIQRPKYNHLYTYKGQNGIFAINRKATKNAFIGVVTAVFQHFI